MKETIIPREVDAKIISLWQDRKSKTAISKELHVCRKKVAKLIRLHEHKEIFDIKGHKNWIL